MKKYTPIYIVIFFMIISSCSTNRLTFKERHIINKHYKNDIMRIRLVTNSKDSVILYTKSQDVDIKRNKRKLKRLVKKMLATVNDTTNPGVGIAAPQIGINRRVILVQRFDKKDQNFIPYINIKITSHSKNKIKGTEGCLSIPGYYGIVMRYDTITVEYDLLDETHHKETVRGFSSVILQHEIDHLDGILYTDRINDKKLIIKENKK